MLIFLHGGTPGVTPYCSGPHIWGKCLDLFEEEAQALQFKGGDFEKQLEEIPRGGKAHLVGHDLGGLAALSFALRYPEDVQAVTAISSAAAAPGGDGLENLTHAYPPQPLWSRASQAWALEQVSYSRHHIDDRLLDACVAAAKVQPQAVEKFNSDVTQAKAMLFEACRGEGIRVPVQVIWGSHDPLGSIDLGLWLFRLVARRQAAAQFHVIQRTGALPFREDPVAFHQVVSAFHEGIS